MEIPKQVKIGGHIYKVEFQEQTDLSENDCGQTVRTKGIIAIDRDLIQSEKEVTFFHEVIHIINGEIEEVECDFIAQTIYAFLKDNNLLNGNTKVK